MFKEDYKSMNISAEEYRREYLNDPYDRDKYVRQRDPLCALEMEIAKALNQDRRYNDDRFKKLEGDFQRKLEEVTAKFITDQAVLNQEIASQNETIEDLRNQIRSLQQDMEVHNIGSDAW